MIVNAVVGGVIVVHSTTGNNKRSVPDMDIMSRTLKNEFCRESFPNETDVTGSSIKIRIEAGKWRWT